MAYDKDRLSASNKEKVKKVNLKENIKQNGSYFSEHGRNHRKYKAVIKEYLWKRSIQSKVGSKTIQKLYWNSLPIGL